MNNSSNPPNRDNIKGVFYIYKNNTQPDPSNNNFVDREIIGIVILKKTKSGKNIFFHEKIKGYTDTHSINMIKKFVDTEDLDTPNPKNKTYFWEENANFTIKNVLKDNYGIV